MNLEEQVGQKLMVGLPGTEVTEALVNHLQEIHASAIILFRRNFQSAAQLKSFLEKLEIQLGKKLLVAVDHEGGRVIHLAEGITVFPDNLALGQTRNSAYAAEQGRIE